MRRLWGAGLWLLLFAASAAAQTAAAQPAERAPGIVPGTESQPPATQAPEAEAATQQAKRLFEQAVADYELGRYAHALSGFQEAYRLKPHPLVRVNMANCYDKLGKPLQAIFHFERFLESDAGSAAQRKEVAAAVQRLERLVGEVTFHVAPDGAVLTLDGGEQRRTPILEPVRMQAGTHRLEVALEGYRPVQREFEVKGGATTEVRVTLEHEAPAVAQVAPSAPPPPPEVTPQEPPPEAAFDLGPAPPPTATPEAPQALAAPHGLPTSVVVAGGVTAALLLSGVVTGVLALGADAEFDDLRSQLQREPTPVRRVLTYNAARDAADRAQALALATDILVTGAMIGAAATSYLFIKHLDRERLALSPRVAPDGAGLTLTASY